MVPRADHAAQMSQLRKSSSDKYAVSQAVGERVLLPAVRQASSETLIVADGFSCQEQIEQATGRRAMHLAQVMQLALHRQRENAAVATTLGAALVCPWRV